jgi:hypothetical protein
MELEAEARIELHREGDLFDGMPEHVPYPQNLVLIGTVNMDETTHGLSDKVLDRAFTLEFWDVDLARFDWTATGLSESDARRTRVVLETLIAALAPARLHFGWRVVHDVIGFLARSRECGPALTFEAALDAVVLTKIVPKLRGDDSARFRAALEKSEAALRQHGLERSLEKVRELKSDLETTGAARFWR